MKLMTNSQRILLIGYFVFGPMIVRAQSDFKWSESPGAFEQHLQRRHNNALFPKERRKITQSDIDAARKRDLKDYELLRERLESILTETAKLPKRIVSSTID